MKTRQDYLNGEVKHREYYAQFVDDTVKGHVRSIGIDRLKRAYKLDDRLNSIPLITWDRLGACTAKIAAKMRAVNDYPTAAGMVCIYKEAANQLIEVTS